MIKTSKHTIVFTNSAKKEKLKSFLKEYRRMSKILLDYLWDSPNTFNDKILDISTKQYNCPRFISIKHIKDTTLSKRALTCCSTQVCGIIRAVLDKPRKQQYMLYKLRSENKPTERLIKSVNKCKITKPNISNIRAELNSICCDFQETTTSFDGFLQLKSIGKSFGKIRIPIKYHRHSNKLNGKLLNSFLISNKSIDFRWDMPENKPKLNGSVVDADQGYKDVLTLSNGMKTEKQDIHNHSLESITKKLSRKKKGSKAFKKAQDHRKNFIHWSINQLNFSDIKELRLEKIVNLGYRKKQSRLMSHWCNTIIRDKVISKCKEEEVLLTLQSSSYRSQRCNNCGWVQKLNRKGKVFKCRKCGFTLDSDLNAAKNLALVLQNITFDFRNKKLNLKGFFWKPDGIFYREDFAVPLSQK